MQRVAASTADAKIAEEITEKLDIKNLSSTSNTLRIADLGCSVGPNTFAAMHNVIEAMKHKYQIQGPASKLPEFQVFYNDHASNDFNTLFASLHLKGNILQLECQDPFIAGYFLSHLSVLFIPSMHYNGCQRYQKRC